MKKTKLTIINDLLKYLEKNGFCVYNTRVYKMKEMQISVRKNKMQKKGSKRWQQEIKIYGYY